MPVDVQTRCPHRSEEVPLHQADGTRVAHYGSKFIKMGVGTQKIEGRFDVRNVTKPIVAAGQVTDAGQGVWLSADGGFILDMKSAKRVEKLLGNKKGFIELRKQKGVYVIPCVDPSSGLFPLIEKESGQRKQMDMIDVGVEEDRPAKAKSTPILPSDKEKEEHDVTHATFRSWCEACVAGRATEDAHRRSAKESSVPLVAMDYGFLGSRYPTMTWPQSWSWLRGLMAQLELAKYFVKDLNLTPLTACWPISIPGAWSR